MVKLLMIMHHITLCTLCITFIWVSHTCILTIDHVEQERKEPPEPAPVKDANPERDQSKPRCI
jgi:hypothetical protein